MSPHVSALADLLNSADPAHVAQGLQLVASLNEPDTERQLLEGAWISEVPRVCTVRVGGVHHRTLRCFSLTGLLRPEAPFSHIAGLLLLLRASRLGHAPPQRIGCQRILLSPLGPGRFVAVKQLELPSGRVVEIAAGPELADSEHLASWVETQPDWQPRLVTAASDYLRVLSKLILGDLERFYDHIPSPLRDALLGGLLGAGSGGCVNLCGLSLTALPGWLASQQLASLSVGGTALQRLPEGLQGAVLSIDASQWRRWGHTLPAVRGLHIDGLSADDDLRALARLDHLTTLFLGFAATLPDAAAGHLSQVADLEIVVRTPQPLPLAILALPRLRKLSLCGFQPLELSGVPPEGLRALLVYEEEVEHATPAWAALIQSPRRRNVWLMSTERKIPTIQVVKSLLGLGLREAKELVESAPCLIYEAGEVREALRIKQELIDSGARAMLR